MFQLVPRCATRLVPLALRRPPASFSPALWAAARRCSSGNNNNNSNNNSGAGTLAGAASPPPSGVPAPPADERIASPSDAAAALTEAEQAAANALIEQLRGLSPADRDLILSALQNPETAQKQSVMGGGGIGTRGGDMVAAFNCGVCDYRMVKKFSKHCYTKGIVIVECPSCRNKHLIADNLGWVVDGKRTVEDFLREKGERFTRIGDAGRDLELAPEAADTPQPPQPPPSAPSQG